jgi:hypothetical protein
VKSLPAERPTRPLLQISYFGARCFICECSGGPLRLSVTDEDSGYVWDNSAARRSEQPTFHSGDSYVVGDTSLKGGVVVLATGDEVFLRHELSGVGGTRSR